MGMSKGVCVAAYASAALSSSQSDVAVAKGSGNASRRRPAIFVLGCLGTQPLGEQGDLDGCLSIRIALKPCRVDTRGGCLAEVNRHRPTPLARLEGSPRGEDGGHRDENDGDEFTPVCR